MTPGGDCSFTSKTLGVSAFLPVEKNCPSFPGGIPPPKVLYPMIAVRQKLPLQRALAALGLLRATSHLPLKHWGSVFSFMWKTTALLLQEQTAETGIPHSKFHVGKGHSPKNLLGQTGHSGLGLL